ncbi:hypothetical protein, conserved [Eimeria tenella]|uniref:Transmembrane protein n=1 Tax=Eimeria tenella TaxID=5802 RepID=U6KZ10_EIMTE|nr:hypothetical protein, conserved [Eimeria tenella]CDJ42168.1 hypothetical protein, conserved [Eimeria tenella]|eukprot:XP_013232918.1 hypothetical protein, conserved [Eimeria tenella]
MLALFLLDVATVLRTLSTTNVLGPYPLDAFTRGLVLLLLMLLVLVAAAAWPRAVHAYELYQRRQELEKITKEQEAQKLRRPSQARPSVTAMLALSFQPESSTFAARWKKVASKTRSAGITFFYCTLGAATKLRAAVTLFLLPAFLAIALPLIFCSDQADVCDSTGLLILRIISFLGVITLFSHATAVLLRDVRATAVARQSRQQEEYLKQRELEYLLFINDDWMEIKVWLVSSFKGGPFRSYFRIWLLLLKAALIVLSSLLGQRSDLLPSGLGWLVSFFVKPAWSSVSTVTTNSLGEAISHKPLGQEARTAVAAAVLLLFCFLSIVRAPFRCHSSNCLHYIVFLHLGGISGIALAAAGSGAKANSFLLYSNQHLLLAVVHACTAGLILTLFGFCLIRCFVPTESPLLQQYELMIGCGNDSNKSRRNMAGSRATVLSFFHNIWLTISSLWEGSLLQKSCGGSQDIWRSSSNDSVLAIGEKEIQENDYSLRPFEAPWPTRRQHARFWIRVAPRLIEQLAVSNLLVQRYAVTEKQLLPVHLVNTAFRDLEALVVQHIGAIEERDTRRRSRRRCSKKSIEKKEQSLEQWLEELRAKTSSTEPTEAVAEYTHKNSDQTTKEPVGRAERPSQDEGYVFKQQQQASEESLWSVDSAAAAAADSAAAAMPNALAFRHLERAAHLSTVFGTANLKELHNLKTIIRAIEWTVAEVFEKMSAIRAAVAAESIWQDSAPTPETQGLLREFAAHLNKRKRQMALLQPVRERILLKLLALRFLTDTPLQRKKREEEKRQQMAQLFGEESSIIFFASED